MNLDAAHAMWAEFHGRAEALPPGHIAPEDVAALHAWLADFDARVVALVPRDASCACSHHWLMLRQLFPPPLHDARAFYLWTVHMHNRVNARLGKPWWTPPPPPSGESSAPSFAPVVLWPASA